jgi:adenosylhomocysteine nucleosidase
VSPVAIVAAMPEEAAPLRSRLQEGRRLARGALTGVLFGRPVVLLITGDGERNARTGIVALLDRMPIERLLVIGVAGALTSDLESGALVLAAEVRSGPLSFTADGPALADAARRSGARPATLITAERIADSPAERARLLGAHGAPAAVDLESATLVRAAVERAVPWLVLRAISDTAGELLPPLLNRSRDDGGAIRRAGVLRGLLREPAAIPALVSLRRRVGRCAQLLADATERLLSAAEPDLAPFIHAHRRGGPSFGGWSHVRGR